MKHQVLNLGSVLACIVATGAGARTALAQAEPPLTPGPGEPQQCPPDETCPPEQMAPPPAQPAQPTQPTYMTPQQQETQALEEKPFLERYGVALTAGGGVGDWFDQDMRDVTGVSGTWEIRGYVGLNEPIGVEVAYVGRASSLNPFIGPDLDTDLVANGVEVAGRVNVFHDLPIQPYGFAGIGWTHFSVSDDVNLADFGMNDSDDILQIPIGAGASWRAPFGLFADARFTFRPTLSEDLIITQVPTVDGQPILPAATFVDMDNWEASARLGYEF